MNYLIMFFTILAILCFMFFAGYAFAYKRFSSYIQRVRQEQRQHLQPATEPANQVVSNRNQSSQQLIQTAARQYNAQVAPPATPAPTGRKRGQG